ASAAFDCEYIFFHDDDLEFTLESGYEHHGWVPGQTPKSRVLVELLRRWRPAVANFRWASMEDRSQELREMAATWAGSEVAPLTGFDSGMTIFHSSIARYMFPLPPNGEGGIEGHWSIVALFLMHVLPTTLREHALRLLPLTYKNLLNIDNLPPERKYSA